MKQTDDVAVRTKRICPATEELGGASGDPEREEPCLPPCNCRNKPNYRRGPASNAAGGGGATCSGDKCAKQSQLAAANGPGAVVAQSAMREPGGRCFCTNKANSLARGADAEDLSAKG